jgi:integrase
MFLTAIRSEYDHTRTGGIFMDALWGKITYNKQRKCWRIRGFWQGQRISFSEYETTLGKRTCQTEDEARQLQIIIGNEIAQGIFNPARYRKSKKLHLKKYAENWLEEIKQDVSSGTWLKYRYVMKSYIIPTLGDRFLPDIGHQDLKKLMQAMNHRAPKTRKDTLSTLHRMMVIAKKDGHLTQLPPWIEFRGKNAVVDPPVKYLNIETQFKVLDSIPERHRPIIMFMMATGCRPSEARAFRKIDIYKDQGHILIEKTFGAKGELKEVKQKKAFPLPFTKDIATILAMVPTDIISPYVFPNPDTGRNYNKKISLIWNKACDDAGVKRIKLYNATRHSYACQLLNSGTDERTISRLLRHSDPRMVKRYVEYEVATLEKAAGKISRFETFSGNRVETEKIKSSN